MPTGIVDGGSVALLAEMSSVTLRCSGDVMVSHLDDADFKPDSIESRNERPVGLAYKESRGENAKDPLLLLPALQLPGLLLQWCCNVLGADNGPEYESSNGDDVWIEIGWNDDVDDDDGFRALFPPDG